MEELRYYEIKVFIPDQMGGTYTHYGQLGTSFQDACYRLEDRLQEEGASHITVCNKGYDDEGNFIVL